MRYAGRVETAAHERMTYAEYCALERESAVEHEYLLRGYLLVAQRRHHLELQVRRGDGTWVLVEAGPGERLPIEPLGIALEVDEVYRLPG